MDEIAISAYYGMKNWPRQAHSVLDSEACSFSSTTVSTAPTTTALNDDKWGSMERLDGLIRLEIAGEFLFNDFL